MLDAADLKAISDLMDEKLTHTKFAEDNEQFYQTLTTKQRLDRLEEEQRFMMTLIKDLYHRVEVLEKAT